MKDSNVRTSDIRENPQDLKSIPFMRKVKSHRNGGPEKTSHAGPDSLEKPNKSVPLPLIKDGDVHFTTLRQELQTKPKNVSKPKKDVVLTSECTWGEPFVLFYEDTAEEGDVFVETEDSKLKFAIQMAYDELSYKKREATVTEHLVGVKESF